MFNTINIKEMQIITKMKYWNITYITIVKIKIIKNKFKIMVTLNAMKI